MSRSRTTANALSSNAVTVLDDIGYKFNNVTKVFTMTVAGAEYSVTDPYQLEIYIGAGLIKPYTLTVDNVYLGTVSALKQGYTVSGSSLIFVLPPSPGATFYGRVMSTSTTVNVPSTIKTFPPLNIALSS
jgi:hypothetical protein